MKARVLIFGLLFAVFFFYPLSYAQVPQMMNYQGKLTTLAGAIIDTTVSMEFKIYDDSIGGTILWSETQSSVKLEYGVFSVLLGSVNPIPFDIWGGGHRYLGVTVGTSPEMTPRKPMVSVPFAYSSLTGGGWVDEDSVVRLANSTDKVGIGTTSPQEKLHVEGNTYINGNLRVGNPIDLNAPCERIGIGGVSGLPLRRLHIRGGSDNCEGNNLPNEILIEGDARIYGTLLGNAIPRLGIVDLGVTGYPSTSPAWYISNWNDRFFIFRQPDINTPGRRFLAIINNGNVGIGTDSPTEKLHVVGNIRMVDNNERLGRVLTSDANGVGSWQDPQAGVPDADWDYTTYSTVKDMFSIPTGSVGIGTTSQPSTQNIFGCPVKLNVRSPLGTVPLHLYQDADPAAAKAEGTPSMILFSDKYRDGSGRQLGEIGTENNNALRVWGFEGLALKTGPLSSGTGQLGLYVEKTNGYVGVGTRAPAGRLNVTGASTDLVNGSCPDGYEGYDEDGNSIIENGECKKTILVGLEDGRVGIGTKDPVVGLTVVDPTPWGLPVVHIGRHVGGYALSAIYLGKHVPANGNYALLSGEGGLEINRPTGSDINFRENNGAWSHMCIKSGGNVGIGLYAALDPSARLDIEGPTGYDQVRMRTSFTPSSTDATEGQVGDIAWDDNYFYVKTNQGWKRVALSTWDGK